MAQSHIPVASAAIAANTGEAGTVFRWLFDFSMHARCDNFHFRTSVQVWWILCGCSVEATWILCGCSIDVLDVRRM